MKSVARLNRRGIVLVIVLVVVVVLSLAAYTYTDLMQASRSSAIQAGKLIQTRLLVDSGIDTVKLYLSLDKASRDQMGGHFNNPYYFQAANVVPGVDALDRGCFSIIAPYMDDVSAQTGVRYGLEDESSRLNLNLLMVADRAQPGAGKTLLMALPNMTEDVADAILDWMDSDSDMRDAGAEEQYYSSLSPPYWPRNAPPLTVEELLLVKGVTPAMLFGFDINRNGIQDTHEMAGAAGGMAGMMGTPAPTTTSTTSSTSLATSSTYFRGWSPYLTLYSSERNVRSDGTPRISLNNSDLEQLSTDLSAVFSDTGWVNFILAYRLYGRAQAQAATGTGGTGAAAGTGGTAAAQQQEVRAAGELRLDLTLGAQGTFAQVLDLIGASVQFTENEVQVIVNSPFVDDPAAMAEYLPLLMENCTVSDAAALPGRININQAPREILLGIPGMSEEIVEQIISLRNPETDPTDPNRQKETWILAEGVATLIEMRALTPFITAGGDVFRAQIVGYYEGGGTASRAEVIFDATESPPRVLFWRNISHLGRGFPLEMLGVGLTTR